MRVRVAILIALAAVGAAIVRMPRNRPPSPLRRIAHIVVLGDSVAHGAGDENGGGISANLHAANFAVNGSRTYDVMRALRTAGAKSAVRAADAVVISIGGNDLFGDRISKLESLAWPSMTMARTIGRVDRLVSEIRHLNPAARVYLLGLYNPYRNSSLGAFLDQQVALWDARLIAHFAEQPNVDVVRIADVLARTSRLSSIDHFHPGHEAYKLIAQRIAMTW
jgi:lysophospholipase L1-like esterase